MTRTVTLALVTGLLAAGWSGPVLAEPCGDLLVVLDRSGSMADCRIGGESKEAIAKRSIKMLAGKFSTVPMGLFVFPDTLKPSPGEDDTCKTGKLVVDMAADGAMKLSVWLDGMPKSNGGTPTGNSMQVVKDYDKWTPGGDHFALVLTDGQPTCEDGISGGKPDWSTGMIPPPCTPPASPTDMCDGEGICECQNPTKVFDAIKYMADKGIHTFVVGFAGGSGDACSGSSAGALPFNPDTLNKMAELGGEPQPGATKFFPATDAATLYAALEKIVGKVVGGTAGGCVKSPDGGAAGGSGGGGGGGGGGAGGQDASSGDDGAGQGGRSPGCACATAPVTGARLPLAVLLAGPALAARIRRRRFGRQRRPHESRAPIN